METIFDKRLHWYVWVDRSVTSGLNYFFHKLVTAPCFLITAGITDLKKVHREPKRNTPLQQICANPGYRYVSLMEMRG